MTNDMAQSYAQRLLGDLGTRADLASAIDTDPEAVAWRRAGLMAITGPAERRLVCPAAIASAADGALLALRALAPVSAPLPERGSALLGERARMMGLLRGGRISANGSCGLVDARDGVVALNRAREDDTALFDILLGRTCRDWHAAATAVADRSVSDILATAIELGLPVAHDREQPDTQGFRLSPGAAARRRGGPLVVDLSVLWAGPLCGSLLAMLGAEVVKVESRTRPDGTRFGNREFHDLLNAGKRSVCLDFAGADDLAALRRLVASADIVIESSRPRALSRLGVDRAREVERGCIWLSITAHDDCERVGFGDDAAVAGGLSRAMATAWGIPCHAGDAIADPLTGLHAAVAGWAGWQVGCGMLVHLSLAGIVARAMTAGRATPAELDEWQELAEGDQAPLYPLRAAGHARPLGSDNLALADFIRT